MSAIEELFLVTLDPVLRLKEENIEKFSLRRITSTIFEIISFDRVSPPVYRAVRRPPSGRLHA